MTPALDSARETLAAGVDSARSELDARRAELVAGRGEVDPQGAQEGEEGAQEGRQEAPRVREEGRARPPSSVKRTAASRRSRAAGRGCSLALAVGTAVFVLLRRKKDDDWTPAPAGDGPVPSYREDPVPSSPSNPGKTVSTADTTGDSAPAGVRHGRARRPAGRRRRPRRGTTNGSDAPEPFTSGGGGSDAGPTAGPDDKQV